MAEAAPKIDFLSPVAETHPRWRRRRIARAMLFGIVVATAGLFAASAAAPGEDLSPIFSELSPRVILRGVGRLFLSSDKALKGESEDRVNILILGMGGYGHDGPLLTDTIILASYKPSTKQVALVSIPRDMMVKDPRTGWGRVNAVNAWAEMAKAGSGGAETAALLSDTLGVQIPYYVRVDFSAFRKIVDEVGGVLVYVDRPFTDPQYPLGKDEVQTVSFSSGWQRMDGERALIFARSRHGSNFEGSDFARSRRQQKVLVALKDELLSPKTVLNPSRIAHLTGIVASHVQANLEAWELLRLSGIAKDADSGAIIHKTLDPDSGGPLIAGSVNGAYMLVPADGSYESIRTLVRDIFSAPGGASLAGPTPAPSRAVRLEIQNGTALAGFASKAADTLKSQGFGVSYVGNATSRGYERTVIYDLSGGRYPRELTDLRRLLDADVSVTIPEWFTDATLPATVTADLPVPQGGVSSADFLIILGKSSASSVSST